MPATVNEEKCVGHGICVNICPVGAIILQDGKAIIDADTCIDCGLCVPECPEEAISMSEDEA